MHEDLWPIGGWWLLAPLCLGLLGELALASVVCSFSPASPVSQPRSVH